MAYTQQQVEALEEAIADGVLTVRDPSGRMVTYQNLDAMERARRRMLDEIAKAAGTARKRTFRIYQRGKGY